jgi:hypothetical protein
MTGFLERLFPSRVSSNPPYWLGHDWTPQPDEIEAARRRQKARRENPTTRWQRVGQGGLLNDVRTQIVFATESSADPEMAESCHMVRKLAYEPSAEFFVRDLAVSQDRYLIEFRHPSLRVDNTSGPIGLRFLGLLPQAWHCADRVCMMLDGSSLPLSKLFGDGWAKTFQVPDLAEGCIRFVFDHTQFDHTQVYVISDADDFVTDDDPLPEYNKFDAALTAQFRVTLAPPDAKSMDRSKPPLKSLKKLDQSLIIPPTSFRPKSSVAKASNAYVFCSIVYGEQLQYACLKLSEDGKIETVKEPLRAPGGVVPPVTPLRSFAAQRASISSAIREGRSTETI